MSNHVVRGILVAALAAVPATASAAAPAPASDEESRSYAPSELNQTVERAVNKGLEFMAKQQGRDGSISSNYAVAGTSMAGLAFMAAGNTPHSGKYAENLRKGLEFILKCTDRTGFISETAGGSSGGSGMHGHGFATLFLAESLGVCEDPALYKKTREALQRAVHMIEETQNEFGGWNSMPDPKANDDGSGAVAIMQIAALRAARNSGIRVKPAVIEKAKKYLLEMTTSEGWYQYNYHSRGSHRSSALTGAGMYMLGAVGLYDDPKHKNGIKNLMDAAPFMRGGGGSDQGWSTYYYYTLFYSSLAIFQNGGAEWKKWYPAMRDEILKRQRADGGWDDSYGALNTAFALLALEMPYRYQPFFQDGGRGREGR